LSKNNKSNNQGAILAPMTSKAVKIADLMFLILIKNKFAKIMVIFVDVKNIPTFAKISNRKNDKIA